MKLKIIWLIIIIFFTGCELDTYNKMENRYTEDIITKEAERNVTKDVNNSVIKKEITKGSLVNEDNDTSIVDSNLTDLKEKKILILDNDAYDPDYMPLLLSAIHENRWGLVNVGLVIITEQGVSNKTNMLYRSILEEFKSDIPLTIAHNTSDRVFRSKLTNNLENYTDIIYDDVVEDAITVLENKLESKDDKTVSYAIGGKLIFLSKFLSDPERLELFKLKVKEVIYALGCNPRDRSCSRDFNLAATNKAYSATKDVYSKLHGKIPFVVIDDKRGRVRSLDMFKSAKIPLMNHLLGTNIYGTYGDHHAGDVEILFAKSRKDNFNSYRCNVALIDKSFKANSINKSGNDYILINKDISINGLTSAIYDSLIYRWRIEQ